MTSVRPNGSAQLALAATLWGTWSLFFRPAEHLSNVQPALEAFVAFAVMLIVIGPLAWRSRLRQRRPNSVWIAMALVGVSNGLNALLFFSAMQKTSIAIAVLTHYLAPVLVALVAPAVLGDRLRLSTWGALGAALLGLTLLLEPWRPAQAIWLGAAMGAASAVFFATNIIVAKRIQHHFSPLELLGWHLPTALLTLAPFAFGPGVSISLEALGLLAAGGLLPGALAGILYIRGLVRVEATRASVLMLLEPVSAMFVGAAVWQEPMRVLGAVGAALVLGAAWMVARAPVQEPKPVPC